MGLENKKVLFVEDEKKLRDVMRDILKDEVAELYIAKNGEEAYGIYKSKKPDIMLLDINIPGLSGIELAKKVREHDHSTKIIMLTAFSDVDCLLAATELKLTKYLIKPLKGDELFDALQLAVDEIKNFNISAKNN